jgi:Flp pilus assembly protein TadD
MRIVILVATALLCGLLSACKPAAEPLSGDEVQQNNLGVGLMGQYKNEEARVVFARLVEARPDWLEARVNLAIATLNRQREGDEQRALEIVTAVLQENPDHERALYIAGLLNLYLGESAAAVEKLQRVATTASDDAHPAYFLGQALVQLDRPEEALAWYREAVRRDPYLRSGYYGAALVLRRQGEREEARQMLEAYQRFENNPRAHLAEFRYTRMGPRAEALAVDLPEADAPAPRAGAVFGARTRLLSSLPGNSYADLTVADIDGDGRLDLFVAGGDAAPSLVLLQASAARFEAREDHPLSGHAGVTAAAWGDIDNDGRVDVFLCQESAGLLFLQEESAWRDVTSAAGLGEVTGCVAVASFDADHDGDLDLLLSPGDQLAQLFNNNLDGTFRQLDTLPSPGAPVSGAQRGIALDLDLDRDADLLLLNRGGPHQVLRNDRLWRYEAAEGFAAFSARPLAAVSAGDLDADGELELYAIDAAGDLLAWRAGASGEWESKLLQHSVAPPGARAELALLDIDGSGRSDLLVHHPGGFMVLGLDAAGALQVLHREEIALTALAPLLLDPAKGYALVGVATGPGGSELLLWPPGSGRQPFLALQPSGRSDGGEGMRSNASGIGTAVLLRTLDGWTLADTYDRHSAPGQSLQPLALGLGGRSRADFVRLTWTDGVLQTELDLAAGELHPITETQRQLASCPVLFAWNGERFEFVSDVLGVGGIGFLLEPGSYSTPRPWEYFRLPEGALVPREGRYALKIAEPMEEIAYLDTLRLHVYDLPAGWNLALDERMHTGGGPAPTGAPVFYREANVLELARAADDRGNDVTALLAQQDHHAAPPGHRDPRFLARLADEHVLELEFEAPLDTLAGQPVLVADGWVEYPYSQTVFAAWQAGAAYAPPTLEAQAESGEWITIYEAWGYPAGMPREMSLPLEGLPAGTRRLRLRTNWEIYWDRIRVVGSEPRPQATALAVPEMVAARVAKTGFARRVTYAQQRPYYDYAERSPFWDTRYPSGFYTALGPVLPLVREQNDAFAVIGPGDELHVEFAAPTEIPGHRRVLVLEARGYAKDMDMYTLDGETVGPLPSTPRAGDPARRDALHERYLNRYQGGE